MAGLRDYLSVAHRSAAPVRPTMIGVGTEGLIPGVTTLTSLGLSAVWRCLDILSNGVSQLEWREMRGNLEIPPSRLVRRPQADRTRREWVSLVVSTMALYDVAYNLRVGGEDSEGVPLALWPIPPNIISPLAYDTWSMLMPEQFLLGNQKVDRQQLAIAHRSPQPGISEATGGVLSMARVTFAAAIAAEHYASRYWQAGGAPTTTLESDLHLNDTEANEISARWTERRSKGPDYAPVMSGGMHAKSFGADITAESAVEARREMVADIGRYFGVPTRILNAPTGDSETYTSSQAANLDLVRFTLQNYIGAIEDLISDQLPPGRRMVMDTSKLTQDTQLAQAQAYQLATGNKPWMKPEEVREAWNLPPQEMPELPAPMPVPAAQGADNGQGN